MNPNHQLARQYCRCVARKLPIGGKRKKGFLTMLQGNVEDYICRNNPNDLDAVKAGFGQPETIALSFFKEMSYAEISKKFQIRNKVIAISLITAFLLLCISIFSWITIFNYNRNAANTYFETINAE